MSTRNDIFAAYGDDVRAGLDAWLNVDAEDFHRWSALAEERQYRTEYRRWLGRQTMTADATAVTSPAAQPRLFEPPASTKKVEMRTALIHEGETKPLDQLAGLEAVRVLRDVCQRDLAPALTAVNRAKFGLALADHIEAETERLGRPVAVSEVMAELREAS